MNKKQRYLFFLFLCLHTFLNAQTQNDSLAKYSYEELYERINDTKFANRELSKIYNSTYLNRAKIDKDTIKISRGYFYLSLYHQDENPEVSFKYLDSIIDICHDCKHDKYPTLVYFNKGIAYYNQGKNKEALDNLFKALESVKKNRNVILEIDVRSAILSVKSNWKSSQVVIDDYYELLDFVIENEEMIRDYGKNYELVYLAVLENISMHYIGNKKYKKSLQIIEEGIGKSILHEEQLMYQDFVFNAGIAFYYLEDYQKTIDSIHKILPEQSDYGKAMGNYYLGKSYHKLNQPEKAHMHFLKVDFLYVKTNDVFPELRDTYEHIVDYYKAIGDTEQQLFYLERLIATDKIIDSTYTYITETVDKKYETPQAIAERNRLLEEAQAKENTWKYGFGVIAAVLLAVLGILLIMFRRQKKYKSRFEGLMNVTIPENENAKIGTRSAKQSRATHVTSESLEEKKDFGVPQEIVENILKQLQKFEAAQKFTKQISLTDLAKNVGTNPKYLSKVINGHYQKNFSSYINELRIEYVISKLKSDSKFRNYTIKSISKEAGFGNTESFSKAFHKTTGIYPSYFIKKLNKRLEN
ncbi:MAG: helix-turn-helix domain-containing protein [Bacteroidota bacterium]